MAADPATAVAAGVAEKLLLEYPVGPLIRSLRRAFCFGNIVKDFQEQKDKLKPAQCRLQHDVDEARRQAYEIELDVQKWLIEFAQVEEKICHLERKMTENRRCFSWCPNGWCRWCLSKEVEKTTLSVKNLIETSTFDRVGYNCGTGSGPELSSNNFMTFKSREWALEQIMEALNDVNVNMIGLHGMGGVGKTTLVKEVRKEAMKLLDGAGKKLFDEVVFASVSQNSKLENIQEQIAEGVMKLLDGARNKLFDEVFASVSQNSKLENIQKQIADGLGLIFTEGSVEGRAERLKKRLGNGDKKILIILDDVWWELNMDDIGIPQNNKGCKILLTTRLQRECLKCQKTIKLEVLGESEAWELFKINADLNNAPSKILKEATVIAERCMGLPIAIVTLGRALRGKSLNGWKAACLKLQSYRMLDIPGVGEGDQDVYKCLMFSYTHLKVQTKKCFLLCSSFPDHEIGVEDLVRCAWGLQLYTGNTLDEARTEVLAVIDELKDSSLLLSSEGIKMHDMFRDLASIICPFLHIPSREYSSGATSGDGFLAFLRNENFQPYKVISLRGNEIKEAFPPDLQKSLEALSLVNVHGMVSSSKFFGEMTELKVLTIAGGSLKIEPDKFARDVFDFVPNLRTLNLVFCGLKDFLSLRELKKLEILTIHDTDIEDLPNEIVRLKNLRLLDLSECGRLCRIPPFLLKELSRLEELYLGNFKGWVTGPEENNARLSELNSLTHLTILSLVVAPKSVPDDFVFPKLNKYEIVIDESRNSGYPTTRSLQIKNVRSLNAFKNLFPDVEYLELDGIGGVQNLVPSLDQEGLTDLTSLALESCQDMKCLVELEVQFINLSWLSALTTLKIAGCFKLNYIFPASLAEKLPPLRVFHLINLPGLKEVLGPVNEQQRNYDVIKLPFLQELEVRDCPQLSAFVASAKIQEFRMCYKGERNPAPYAIPPQLRLKNMEFFAVGNFQDMFQFKPETKVSNLKVLLLNGLTGLQVIWTVPDQRVSLQYLTELVLINCNSLKYVFTPSLHLPQLRLLKIIRCHGLEQILQSWHQIALSSTSTQRDIECLINFPNLSHINIESCKELKSLLPSSIGHCLQNLEVLCVEHAPKLEQVFGENKADADREKSENPRSGSLVLRNLRNLKSFCPFGHHFQFPYLNQLSVTGCPKIITSFGIDSNLSVHAKTEAPASVVRNTSDNPAVTGEEITWAVGSNINWQRNQKGII